MTEEVKALAVEFTNLKNKVYNLIAEHNLNATQIDDLWDELNELSEENNMVQEVFGMKNSDKLQELVNLVDMHNPHHCMEPHCQKCMKINHLRKLLFPGPGLLPNYPYKQRAGLRNTIEGFIRRGDDILTISDELNALEVFVDTDPNYVVETENVEQLLRQLSLLGYYARYEYQRKERFGVYA